MADTSTFLMEDFIHSIAAQLDRVQDALRLKAVNRPLTYALKDFSLDVHVFAEVDARGEVRFRTAGPNEAGASVVRIGFTTITKAMIEENTISLQATRSPGLEELGLSAEDQKRLEHLGVRNASQLQRLQSSTGTTTIQRLAGVPVGRLREALARSKPVLRQVSVVKPGLSPEQFPPRIETRLSPDPASGSFPAPGAPIAPEPTLPVAAEPKPSMSRVRVEGRNLLGYGVPRAKVANAEVALVSMDDDAIEMDVPSDARALTLELPHGEVHVVRLGADSTAPGDPWEAAR